MGAFASVTLPITGGALAGPMAREIIAAFPGTRDVAVDAGGGSVSFELHFPGNLDALVVRLGESRIAVGPHGTVSIPVTVLAPEHLTDVEHVTAILSDGPHVWDPEFTPGAYVSGARYTGSAVEATIVPCTDALHQLYDSMLHLGLTARAPSPAGAP